jgi:hypothetical protein
LDKAFEQQMRDGYALQEPSAILGFPLHDEETLQGVPVQVALSMLNRHGLVAGATGTGKTKSLQVLAGQLSDAGIPVFIADVKGDLTGLGAPGNAEDARSARAANSSDGRTRRRRTRSSCCRCPASWAPRSARPFIPSDRSCWRRCWT